MSPEEDRTRDAVDSEPKHYQLSYSGPDPETFSAIQTVKYSLKVAQKSSVDYFRKTDPLREPVDGRLTQNLRTA